MLPHMDSVASGLEGTLLQNLAQTRLLFQGSGYLSLDDSGFVWCVSRSHYFVFPK